MKQFIALALFALLAACSRTKTSKGDLPKQHTIAGVFFSHEWGRLNNTWDTLIISQDQVNPNLYQVLRRSAFKRSLTGKALPIERVQSEWCGMYDDISHVLSGINQVSKLCFNPEQDELELAGITYLRVE
jgi:hypothetical protein